MPQLHDTDTLLALAATASSGPTALDEDPWLLWAGDVPDPSTADWHRLSEWLRQCACPVIAVGAENPLADACVGSLQATEPLLASIRRTPVAAAVLVQTLRGTSGCEVEAGLQLESLAYASLQAGNEFRQWLASYSPSRSRVTDPGPAVLIERKGSELQLQLNRPSRRNALSVEMRDALLEALSIAIADEDIEHIELSGRGRCFSTGGDLDEFGQFPDPAIAHLVRCIALPGRALFQCGERVTAKLHGACVGSGIEIPAFAEQVVAAPDSWFQLPELKYGLIPGAGGCVSIVRRIGRQKMAEWVLSGTRINATTALDWGLIDEIA